MNTCITSDLFGISQEPCDCYTNDLDNIQPPDDDWYKRSTSGLYLDELEPEGLISLRVSDGSMTCNKTLGTFYKEARDLAIKRTIDDTHILINGRFKPKRDAFSGQIGGKSFNRSLLIPGAAIAGIILSMKQFKDGVFKLNQMIIASTVTNPNATYSIFRILPDLEDYVPELVQNILNVSLIAGRSTIKTFSEPIVLPMEYDGERANYLFVRNLEDGELLPNTSRSCGCGKKEALFNEYASFQGITIDVDSDNISDYKTSDYSYGITLIGSFDCDSEAIICRMFDKNASFRKVFAYACMYLAAAIVNERVNKNPDVNRWSMINFEDIKMSAINFRGEYQDRLTWLSQNTDPSANDCYSCGLRSESINMSKQKIGYNRHGRP